MAYRHDKSADPITDSYGELLAPNGSSAVIWRPAKRSSHDCTRKADAFTLKSVLKTAINGGDT